MTEINEIWKPVVGWEDQYMVSSLGRVKSLDKIIIDKAKRQRFFKGQILKPRIDTKGYLRVGLSKGSVHYNRQIHRLVAEAFIPNINNLPEVNHRDENPKNDCLENLEWCDRKYNVNYGTRTIRMIESKKKGVLQFDLNNTIIKKWESAKEASENTGIGRNCICGCCKNKYGRKSAGGYIWKYYDLETYLIALMNKNIKKGAS